MKVFVHRVQERLQNSVEFLRNQVVINPNLRSSDLKFYGLSRMTIEELEALLIWVNLCYPKEDWSYRLRFTIEERIERRPLDNWRLVPLLATSNQNPEVETLLLFQDKTNGDMRPFFGNFETHLRRALRKLRVVTQENLRVRKPQRKRGYNDKGSRNPDSAWKHARAFWQDRLDQEEIERQRQTFLDTIDFLRGWFT